MAIDPKGAFKIIAERGTELAANLGDTAKGTADKAKETADRAAEKAKVFADDAAIRAHDAGEVAQQKMTEARREIDLKLYNPLFPETLNDPDFVAPRMIVIADAGERKNVEVCKGAIGWTAKAGGLQVLFLYDTAVQDCHFLFQPFSSLDSIYYRDSHDPLKYLNLGSFFSTMQQEQMAELQSVAASLGAKHCKLTSYEMKKEIRVGKGGIRGKAQVMPKLGKSNNEDDPGKGIEARQDAGLEISKERQAESKVEFDVSFEGSNEPVMPNLKWYAHDRVILDLIRSRIEGTNPMKEYNLILEYKTSESMPIKAAAKVDAALKQLGATMNFDFASEVRDESRRKLEFHIEF